MPIEMSKLLGNLIQRTLTQVPMRNFQGRGYLAGLASLVIRERLQSRLVVRCNRSAEESVIN